MHNKAMEMAKWAMADACAKGYDCMTSQDWDDFKDCVETAKNAIKADYYYHLVCEMKDREKYKLSAEEYKGRTAEELRDMDRKTRNVMYYSEPTTDKENRLDKAKRVYEETKRNNPEDKMSIMKEAEKFTNILLDELDGILEGASQEVKNMIRTKGMSRMQKIQ